jgi:hypothetical protein
MERCIAIEDYLATLMRYTTATASFDNWALRYMTSAQLSTYLLDHCLPLVDPFHHIEDSFADFYAVTAVLKFQFFLDPRNKNLLSIRHVAHSDVMLELQSLISITQYLHSDTENVRVFGYNIEENPMLLKKKVKSMCDFCGSEI